MRSCTCENADIGHHEVTCMRCQDPVHKKALQEGGPVQCPTCGDWLAVIQGKFTPPDAQKVVLAGTFNEFKRFMLDSGLKLNEAIYIHSPAALKGRRGVKFVVLSGFWHRRDAGKIWDELVLCNRGVESIEGW